MPVPKKVVIAPAGNDSSTIVYNVNHEEQRRATTSFQQLLVQQTVVWLQADLILVTLPIQSGIMCTIHAYTGDQMTLTVLKERVT